MTNLQLEELRRTIRGYLAERAALAFNVLSIHRGISREVSATQEETASAVEFLVDLGHVKTVPSQISAVKYYQATAAGTLAHERGD